MVGFDSVVGGGVVFVGEAAVLAAVCFEVAFVLGVVHGWPAPLSVVSVCREVCGV